MREAVSWGGGVAGDFLRAQEWHEDIQDPKHLPRLPTVSVCREGDPQRAKLGESLKSNEKFAEAAPKNQHSKPRGNKSITTDARGTAW